MNKLILNSKRYQKIRSMKRLIIPHKFTVKSSIPNRYLKKPFVLSFPNLGMNLWSAFGISSLFYIIYQIYSKSEEIKHFNLKTYTKELLNSKEVKEGGSILVNGILKEKDTKDAVVDCLNTILCDEVILKDATSFGATLLTDIIKEEELKTEIKKLLLKIVQGPELKNEAIELVNFITYEKMTEDILARYFKDIFVREDIIQALTCIVSDSIVHTLNSGATKKKFAEFITDVWSDPSLRWFVIKKSVDFWSPTPGSIPAEVRDNLTKIANNEKNGTLPSSDDVKPAVTDKEEDKPDAVAK